MSNIYDNPNGIPPNIKNLSTTNMPSSKISIRELLLVVWKNKLLITTITFIFAIASVGISLYLPNIYKADVIIAAAESEQSTQMSNISSHIGNLASLAGVNLGESSSSKTIIALQVLQSQKFLSNFIKNHDLLIPLMASNGWDRDTGKLKIDDSIYDIKHKKWVRDVKPPFHPKPSFQEAYRQFIKNNLAVSQDDKTGIIKVSVNFYSPEMVQKWARWLINDLNEEIRTQDMIDAKKSMKYLEKQLSLTSFAENRTMLYQLIEQQTKTLMLTKVRSEYVFKTIDPAVVPELKSSPKRALICIFGTILGAMLITFIIFVIFYIKNSD